MEAFGLCPPSLFWNVYRIDMSPIDKGRTFGENGVLNGMTLRLVAEGYAGGSEDLPIPLVLSFGEHLIVDLPSDMIAEDAV